MQTRFTGAGSRPGPTVARSRPAAVPSEVGTPRIHPRFRAMPAPILVVGMHRCGTSLVAAILGRLGVYVGPEYVRLEARGDAFCADAGIAENGYAEAEAFRLLNDRLLGLAGASWDRLEGMERGGAPEWREDAVRMAASATFGALRRSYFAGVSRDYRGAWGWKDPRNSLTLPCWLQLFPDARVVHVRRSREATVSSLHRRAVSWSRREPPALTRRERAAWALRNPAAAAASLARRAGLLPAPVSLPDPCLDREYCGALYDAYVETCRGYARLGTHYSEVAYEDLTGDPAASLRHLTDALDLRVSGMELESAARLVRPRRCAD